MSKLVNMVRRLWNDRDERNLFINIIVAFAVKGLALLISMFSTPLYIKYFDNESVLGVWYTILSLLSWITVCDLGLGNGLRNRLTEALSVGDEQKGKQYVSSTYVLLILIIIPVMVVGSVVLSCVNLNGFFGIAEDVVSAKQLRISILILFNGVGLNFILKTINSVIYAVQKSSLNNIISLVISALPLCYIALSNGGEVGDNLIHLSVVHILSINLPLLVATVALFSCRILRACAPSLKFVDFKVAKNIVGFGLSFFLAQVFFMCIMSTNELFITRMFSARDVVDYTIYYKLFTVVGSLFMLALTPLWSKVTKDFAEKHYVKLRKTNHLLYIIAFLAITAQFCIVPCLQWIVDIWLRDEAITVSTGAAMTFAAFGGLYVFNVVLTTVANGIGNLKTQIVFYGIGALLKVPVCMLMKLAYCDWTIVVMFNCIILLLFCAYQVVWLEQKLKLLVAEEETEDNTSKAAG